MKYSLYQCLILVKFTRTAQDNDCFPSGKCMIFHKKLGFVVLVCCYFELTHNFGSSHNKMSVACCCKERTCAVHHVSST